jgi:hypothetical protein
MERPLVESKFQQVSKLMSFTPDCSTLASKFSGVHWPVAADFTFLSGLPGLLFTNA